MPTISKINWTSIPSGEAEVTVTAGDIACATFCQPCGYQEGDRIVDPLHIFGLTRAMRSDAATAYIEKILATGLAQRGVGRVVDLSCTQIAIGELQLVFDDYMPGGLSVGDMIEFECARVDLW